MSLKLSIICSGAALCVLPLLAACGGSGAGLPPKPVPDPPATGSSSSINQSTVPSGSLSLQELLQGKASGLEFITDAGGSQRMQIRGMASISQTPEPLVLVDDIQIPMNQLNSALAGLTRDDIKRVDVLKDIASTSSYGMRAAGGVILIYTTRR